jgi:hypothetical protein
MQRLTIHIDNAKTILGEGKGKTFNTISHEVKNRKEALSIIKQEQEKGLNIFKWQISNIK